ncbi:MAG: hypothetical protein WCC64_10500 [Aliidongia sp.]
MTEIISPVSGAGTFSASFSDSNGVPSIQMTTSATSHGIKSFSIPSSAIENFISLFPNDPAEANAGLVDAIVGDSNLANTVPGEDLFLTLENTFSEDGTSIFNALTTNGASFSASGGFAFPVNAPVPSPPLDPNPTARPTTGDLVLSPNISSTELQAGLGENRLISAPHNLSGTVDSQLHSLVSAMASFHDTNSFGFSDTGVNGSHNLGTAGAHDAIQLSTSGMIHEH